MKNLLKKILFGLILSGLTAIAVPHNAAAVSNIAPDPNEYSKGSNIWLEVAHPGDGSSLDAPRSDVVVYFTQPSGTVRLTSASDMCHFDAGYGDQKSQSGPDTIAPATTIFSFYKGTNPGSQLVQQFDGYNAGCGINDQSFSGLSPVQVGDQTLYPVFISATLSGGGTYGSVNAFKYQILGSGYISFYSGSGNQFALQDRESGGNPVGDYDMRFGTDCSIASDQPARLDWFDADYGSSFQPSGGYYFELKGSVPGQPDQTIKLTYINSQGQQVTTDTVGGADLGGVGDPRSATFTAQPNFKYQWYWHNVSKKNGIQFQMPYNSVFSVVNCNQPPIGDQNQPTCTAGFGWMFDPDSPGTELNYYLYVNGQINGPGLANRPRGDVNAVYGVPGNHGFVDSLPAMNGWNPRGVNTIQYKAVDAQTGQLFDISNGTRTVGPCVVSTCGGSNLGALFGVNEPVDLGTSVTITGGFGPPYVQNSDPKMYITVRNTDTGAIAGGFNDKIVQYTYDPNPQSGFPATLTSSGPSQVLRVPTAGNYTVTWRLQGSSTNISCTGDVAPNPPPNHIAGYQPYFRIEDGDAAAGPGFGTTGACSQTPGDITGFNRLGSPDYGSSRFFGAGSQLGAVTLGDITGFSTATDKQIAANPTAAGVQGPPGGLAFANGTPKGKFGRSSWCVPDYYTDAVATDTVSPSFAGKHVYQVNGTYNLSGATLSNGADITIKVNGDAIISNNVSYGSYSSLAQIPRFKLLVTGNIYVQSNVAELHGFYTAQPGGNANKGKFYTCASGTSASQNYNNCNSKLTVYGSVNANRIVPGRTVGNYNDDVVNPAESFEYSPELWIFSATSPTAGAGYSSYDSITNLPPVL